ncbi:hypothetical protein [Laribacter hongkongensis]|uniref:hypothetical protein n=1 Tax=Laribacter hongkongensis TaxID=168471 RepID=UPI001EFC5F47|nr:hypothetical protein [Laribacter hongkongensis]
MFVLLPLCPEARRAACLLSMSSIYTNIVRFARFLFSEAMVVKQRTHCPKKDPKLMKSFLGADIRVPSFAPEYKGLTTEKP